MAKQTDEIEELEEVGEDRGSYDHEEKAFNMIASQMSEPSWKFLGRNF